VSSVDDIELQVGETRLKGVWIAVVLSFASTIGGGIWAASEFFSRLDNQEVAVEEAITQADNLAQRFDDLKELNTMRYADFQKKMAETDLALETADVSQLQGRLATIGENLSQIMEAQKELLQLRDRIAAVEKSNSESVMKIDAKLESLSRIEARMVRLEKDMDSAWMAMDELANPLGR